VHRTSSSYRLIAAAAQIVVIGIIAGLTPASAVHAMPTIVDHARLTSVDAVAASEGRAVSALRRDGAGLTVEHYAVDTAADARTLAAQLKRDARVVASAVDEPRTAMAASNDQYRSMQWDLDILQAETVWSTASGNGVTVAVIDSGVDGTHPDLAGQVLAGVDMVTGSGNGWNDDSGHGTHVAGTIAATANNSIGVAGVAPSTKILPVRVIDDNGPKIINLSLGGDSSSSVEHQAVQYAASNGVLVVCAAGNFGSNGNPVVYPAAHAESFAVSASDASDNIPGWLSSGSYVAVTAPGINIANTVPNGGYNYLSGSSMASPHAAAAAAILLSYKPSLTASQVETALELSARDKGTPGRDDRYGYGIIDIQAALTEVDDPGFAAASADGYWLVASDGGIFSFGDAAFFGSTGDIKLNKPIVGMAASASGEGYRLVASDGGIFSFGDATFHGSTGSMTLNQPIVGMAATPSGNGYWLVASDGGIFSFGDATFYGSTGSIKLNKPIVGMAATPSGKGYLLVASDGGIFAYGDAAFHGSTGSMTLNRPIVGMATTAPGQGYWLVASDGGIFSFGDADFQGSAVGSIPSVVGITSMGNGYVIGGANGQSKVSNKAATSPLTLNKPIVAIAAR
jgi:hypothetical protein